MGPRKLQSLVKGLSAGYILRIASHSPTHPWWRITDQIAEGLNGYKENPSLISSVGVYTGRFGLGSVENPKMVGGGKVEVGITNPPVNAKMAMEGIGPFSKSVGELRALARFPEPDYIFWLVAEELGVNSMEELARRKPPIILVSGRMGPTGSDTLTWTVEEVMRWYGFTYKDIEAWGGKVLFPGPAIVGVPMVRSGQANAIFQEGVHDKRWEELAEERKMRCLPLDPGAVEHMKKKYGFDEAIIPKGRLKGIAQDLLTVNFGGWLLFCRADLPDEVAYILAKTSMERRDDIAAPYRALPPHLRDIEVPITPEHLCTKCVIPVHPGAEQFYKDFGCL
jgi:TRAP-type uncharacterized transport system substrate-binding protein